MSLSKEYRERAEKAGRTLPAYVLYWWPWVGRDTQTVAKFLADTATLYGVRVADVEAEINRVDDRRT